MVWAPLGDAGLLAQLMTGKWPQGPRVDRTLRYVGCVARCHRGRGGLWAWSGSLPCSMRLVVNCCWLAAAVG